MKKTLLLAIILVITSIVAFAQEKMYDYVHLKNGSIIKGIIFEQTPNESLKIKTSDGSIYVYQMSDVAKLTRDVDNVKSTNSNPSVSMFKETGNMMPISKGYRGFADIGFTIGTGDYKAERIEISTTHGYQLNPFLYLGAGLGFHYYYDGDAFGIPVFANPRVYFTDSKVRPFVDLKIGYTFADAKGFYCNPNIGASFMVNQRNAVNVSLGYTIQNVEAVYEYLNFDYYGDPYWSNETKRVNVGGISLKVVVEF